MQWCKVEYTNYVVHIAVWTWRSRKKRRRRNMCPYRKSGENVEDGGGKSHGFVHLYHNCKPIRNTTRTRTHAKTRFHSSSVGQYHGNLFGDSASMPETTSCFWSRLYFKDHIEGVSASQGQGQGLQKRDKEEWEKNEKDDGSRSGPASQTNFAIVTDQLASGEIFSLFLSILLSCSSKETVEKDTERGVKGQFFVSEHEKLTNTKRRENTELYELMRIRSLFSFWWLR